MYLIYFIVDLFYIHHLYGRYLFSLGTTLPRQNGSPGFTAACVARRSVRAREYVNIAVIFYIIDCLWKRWYIIDLKTCCDVGRRRLKKLSWSVLFPLRRLRPRDTRRVRVSLFYGLYCTRRKIENPYHEL